MLKLLWVMTSFFLIIIIILQMPKDEGLADIATRSNIMGSSSSSLRFPILILPLQAF